MKKMSSADKEKATTKSATKKTSSRKRVSETAKRKPIMRFSREGKAKS